MAMCNILYKSSIFFLFFVQVLTNSEIFKGHYMSTQCGNSHVDVCIFTIQERPFHKCIFSFAEREDDSEFCFTSEAFPLPHKLPHFPVQAWTWSIQ